MIEFALAAITAVFVYRVLRSNFKLGFAIFFLDVIFAWWLPSGIQITSVAGTNIFLADLIFLASIVLFVQSSRELSESFPLLFKLTLGISFIFAISLCRGIFIFGLQPAINESRLIIYPIASLMWGLYSSKKICPRFSDLRLIATFIAICMLSVEIVNVVLHGFGSASDIQLVDGSILNLRPLVHIQALSLLAAFSILLICAFDEIKHRGRNSLLAAAALIGIFISQQRSVLVATIATFSALLFQRRTALLGALTLILGLFFALFIPWSSVTFIPHELRSSLADSSSNLTTFIARSGSWIQYLNSFRNWDLVDQLLGKPFGTGWGRYDGANNLWVEFNPHNWYLILLLRTGFVGAVLFIILYIKKVVVAIKVGPRGYGLFLIQLQHLIFQYFYPMPWQIVQVVAIRNSELEESPPEKRNSIS